MTERIAIVGMAGRFPGSGADLDLFWRNVAGGVDASREVPSGRWVLPPEQCFDPRVANPDTVYSTRGYYLDPFEPDLTGLRIDAAFVAQLDPLFHLVLDVGGRAWRSAHVKSVDRTRVGIVMGNICLPTDKANDLCREYLGGKLGLGRGKPTHPLNRYVAGLPAGVLAKSLGLGGGSYTLDAACASSLYAIKLAADELLAGRADAMLAGGSNRPDCQYTQMGFAQLRALSASGRCAPFDGAADGLMVGEGAGLFVLKRLSDALRQGDCIHATIAGVGLSNDMHGNLLAPAKEGQLRAMRKAYERAGFAPADVDLIECHATGTPVGDAVEFESLRELWGESGWVPGQCVIGSVKSTTGHLLTGAGAAAVAKVLLAMKAETRPPQANFHEPAAGLNYQNGPFRVLATSERWSRRTTMGPRKAAVSGFGFGGVNAHLLLEEWAGVPYVKAKGNVSVPQLVTPRVAARAAETTPVSSPAPTPIAIVGLAAQVGPWADLRAFQERVLGGGEAVAPTGKHNGWGLAEQPSPPGYFIEELLLPIDRFRIPPKELEETLPQQLLMLQVAAAALDDASGDMGIEKPHAAGDPHTGVFIGLGLDLNATNFHLRWAALANAKAQGQPSLDLVPPLSANRTMGALGSIAASRIARAFHFGGPSFTLCSEEASAARALEVAVHALQAGELNRAVVGGVDLAGDPRSLLAAAAVRPEGGALPSEGAAALVLKRLADAERDGDRVYAVIRGVGVAGGGAPDEVTPSPKAMAEALRRACAEANVQPGSIGFYESDDSAEAREIAATGEADRNAPSVIGSVEAVAGHSGAASAALGVSKVALALYQEIIPSSPRYWLHDRANGPRRAAVAAHGADGSCFAFVLEERAGNAAAAGSRADRRQPLGARAEAMFAVEGHTPADLQNALHRLVDFAADRPLLGIEALARSWLREEPTDVHRPLAVTMAARSAAELREQLDFTARHLKATPEWPLPAPRETGATAAVRDRVFYAPKPLGPKAKVALVFPGSGNQFDGMGRELGVQWPEVLRRQQAESALLRSQFAPDLFWDDRLARATLRDLMFGQVTVGALVADVLAALGVKADAMIGLSLGESAGLFGIRAWNDRDEMFQRLQRSTLFNTDLAPPYDAARAFWGIPAEQAVDWTSGIVAASMDDVVAALRPGLRAFLLIVNTPTECVIGGLAADVEKLARAIGKPYFPLAGVTLAHCEAASPVEVPYRELHTLPVAAPKGIAAYSGAWGRKYAPTARLCAESITLGVLQTIEVPAVVEAAYRDGVRVFLEVGPGNSCTRMIDAILGNRPHLARAAHAARQDATSQILRLVAQLAAERVAVDLGALYGVETRCLGHRLTDTSSRPTIVVPVGMPPIAVEPEPVPMIVEVPALPKAQGRPSLGFPEADDSFSTQIAASCAAQAANMQAQETFLRFHQNLMQTTAQLLGFQTALLQQWLNQPSTPNSSLNTQPSALSTFTTPLSTQHSALSTQHTVPRSLDFEQCCAFAAGRVGDVLGSAFAEADTFPTRVRLPDGPLQLVDRVVLIEGEPKSMTAGRVVTEHTVRADRWYLEAGRIPTALAVESGQADLFLAGFLGIDFQTRGLAVYRLLDAVVSFHRGLPQVGETIRYDIRIDGFTRQGDAWLFRFHYDGTVDGEPFITMRNGVAGFFTAAALAGGKGIVHTALDARQLPGQRPADWRDLVPQSECALTCEQVSALRVGDLAAAFGPAFAKAALHSPVKLPGGMLRLVDRVPRLDPHGGRFGIGFIRAEYNLKPPEWFIECHFVDDKVMPGTLMYECCLHTLRILLMRMGWVAEEGEAVCEPVPGVDSRLKCRGQVTDAAKTVTYEVTLKEFGFRPEPFAVADALMYADGKPIVEITNMTLRMTGLTRERLEEVWGESPFSRDAEALRSGAQAPDALALRSEDSASRLTLYGPDRILAFSNGNPSDAFGEPYRPFDSQRKIARLPGPPFQFLDRITAVAGEPFVLKAGAACDAHYDVPADAWYFAENRGEKMPFSILLELALQPCGWLAAYCGSALTSAQDLRFRNLGGKATQFRAVTPASGTLTTTVKLTSVSNSAGMIIQHYAMAVRDRVGVVYEGTTYFGFFSADALANQVGIPKAKVPWPTQEGIAHGELPRTAPFPAPMMRMVDAVDYLPTGGGKGLGLAVGKIAVDPAFWFFQAHFYQDPVWPGSLGLESFLQLLKYAAWKRWGEAPPGGWQTVALNRPHSWQYRGQVVPGDREVAVLLEVAAVEEEQHRMTANGFLTVDGRVIYQMTGFTLE